MTLWTRVQNLWFLSGQVPQSVTDNIRFINKEAVVVDLVEPLDKIQL